MIRNDIRDKIIELESLIKTTHQEYADAYNKFKETLENAKVSNDSKEEMLIKLNEPFFEFQERWCELKPAFDYIEERIEKIIKIRKQYESYISEIKTWFVFQPTEVIRGTDVIFKKDNDDKQ